MAKITIENKILEHLLKGNRINQWNSYELFQYTRLSATIFNLRAKGHVIEREWKKAPSGKRYKEYWLAEKKVEEKKTKKVKENNQEGFEWEVEGRFEWPD